MSVLKTYLVQLIKQINNYDCIYIAILQGIFNIKPLVLSADITVPAICHTYYFKSLRAGDGINAT
jgi:hypothetical protein